MTHHIVVVGGGVVGLAVAHHCLNSGLQVTVLEPGEAGQAHAASYGNAGWLSSHSVIPPAYPGVWRQVPKWLLDPLGPLTIRWGYLPKAVPWISRYLASAWTHRQVEKTAKALRTLLADAPFLHQAMATAASAGDLIVTRELLHVYPDRAAFGADARAWAIREKLGIDWRVLEGSELRNLEPELTDSYQLGVLVKHTGFCVNPGAYVAALMADCQKRGASLVRGTARQLIVEGNKVRTVVFDQGSISADGIVIAAGARSKDLARQVGDKVPLATERGYHYVVQADQGGPSHPTMFMDRKLIVTPMATGIRVAGQVELADLDDLPNWQRAAILRRHLASLYPNLAQRTADEQLQVWMGRRPSTPDGLPCIGRARVSNSVIHAYGHGHVGLAGSARTGQWVAKLLTGQLTEADLSAFSPQRFR